MEGLHGVIRMHRVEPSPRLPPRPEAVAFEYCGVDGGGGEVISINRFRERAGEKRSDEIAAEVILEQPRVYQIERRTDWIPGGAVLVSRTAARASELADA
jgi:hypothetical protein